VDENGNRSIGVVYSPTPETLNLSLHYNNSDSPRANAIAANRGDGFVVDGGSTAASLNMASDRSALGTATGHARASFSGRADEQSAGGDRHLAIAVSGTQTTGTVQIHSISVSGVQ
jgi:hypothetical protein